MTFKEHFTDLYAYNQWANELVLMALKQANGGTQRCMQLMTHILSAQQAWLQRVAGTARNVALWDTLGIEQLEPLLAENHTLWLKFWHSFEEINLEKTYTYSNSQGKSYNNTLREIATHNVNHSSYHRAQINQLLRQNGYEPVLTDFIAYRRLQTGQV